MTPIRQSRRALLKEAAAVAVATSVGLGGATGSRRAAAQGGATQSRARIDSVLKQPVDAREVSGVVAIGSNYKARREPDRAGRGAWKSSHKQSQY